MSGQTKVTCLVVQGGVLEARRALLVRWSITGLTGMMTPRMTHKVEINSIDKFAALT